MLPFLTILLTDSVELDQSYLDLYFQALRDWNANGLDDLQVIILSQRKDCLRASLLAAGQRFDVRVLECDHDFAGGYPIWDILSSARKAWPLVEGEYVHFSHPEFIWGPGRLRKTIDWLKANRPYYANGNLRRPGKHADIAAQKTADHCVIEPSENLRKLMASGQMDAASRLFDSMPTCWWMFWIPEQKPGDVPYAEDVFFADKEWLEAWQFTAHGGELPFQDVYDLMGMAFNSMLPKYKLAPQCVRMPQSIHKMIHLWHPKAWDSWTPEVRDYFLGNPERWKGTKFLDAAIWERLIASRGAGMPKDGQPVSNLRNAPGGTVTRYGLDLSVWLQSGGKDQLEDFYRKNGRQRRAA